MARWLKQSTAKVFRIGPFLDSTDGVTAETGLTIAQADIQISKDGGAFAQTSDATPTTTHDADGWYECPLTATDTDTVGILTVQITMAGALPIWEHFDVRPANVFDSFAGADKLQVDAVEISGDATAADNLELFFDGTGYDAANSAIGTVASATAIASGGIAAASFAAGAIDAAALAADAVDEIWDETFSEPSAAAPAATVSMRTAQAWFWMAFRNQVTATATELALTNDAGTALAEADLSDDGTTFAKSELRTAT